MATVRALDVAIRANTQNAETGFRNLSRMLKGAVLGMNAVAAASAGVEKSAIGMINAVAIGFATGGPWGAALAGAGVAIGALVGEMKKGADEWDASMKKIADSTRKTRDEIAKLDLRLSGRTAAEQLAADIRFDIDRARRRLEDIRGQTGSPWNDIQGEREGLKQRIGALGTELGFVNELIAKERDVLEVERQIKENREALANAPLPWDVERLDRLGLAERMAERRARPMLTPADFERETPFAELLGTDILPFPDEKQLRLDEAAAAADRVAEAMNRANEYAARAATTTTNFLMGIVQAGRSAEAQLQNVLGLLLQLASQQLYKGLFTAFGGTTGIATP